MILIANITNAQMPVAITIVPPNATAYDEMTLIFDPSEACFMDGSLMGLDSIAMHSGVTLITGETWHNVIFFSDTGANGQSTILYPTEDGKFSITYTPSEFYGLEGEVITQICAVFNNGSSWANDGRDFQSNSTYCMDFFIPINIPPITQFYFSLNMNKMIIEENFVPDDDEVYVEINEIGSTLLTDFDSNGIFDGQVIDGIEQNETYEFQFRINQDIYEDIVREITAIEGVQYYAAWWNDNPLGITFVVDMSYQMQLGTFIPGSDFVDIAGTMNGWNGSDPLIDIGDGKFAITIDHDPGVVEYKYRINGDWATSEFPDGGPNRLAWIAIFTDTLFHYYSDYNPDTWPATFEVDMNNEITNGNFNPETEFLDIAGTFNGWGTNYPKALFDRDWTANGIYTTTLLINKENPDIEFKFRINGDWLNSEFPGGGPNRELTVQDTAGGLVNLYACQYGISTIPQPPYVYDVWISGYLEIGGIVTGEYTYFDPNLDPEGSSIFQWYYAEHPDSTTIQIPNANSSNYTVEDFLLDQYLMFEVIPVSVSGTPNVGDTVQTWSANPLNYPQSCLPEGIIFMNQEQVDNFHNDYPNCCDIGGSVKIIRGINNLNGLLGLKSIGGDFRNEIYTGGTFQISLVGLDSLEFIGGSVILSFTNIENFQNLSKLQTIGGCLTLAFNGNITNFYGLGKLSQIGEDLRLLFNSSLTSLNGLDGLLAINEGIEIYNNGLLTNLTAIENTNLSPISWINIYNNPSLSDCATQSICDYLATPNAIISIYNNAPGCNSQEEVEAACAYISVPNIKKETGFSIYPNPAEKEIFISGKEELIINEVNIYNKTGQKVLYEKHVNKMLDISGLQSGMYIVEISLNDYKVRKKIIIER